MHFDAMVPPVMILLDLKLWNLSMSWLIQEEQTISAIQLPNDDRLKESGAVITFSRMGRDSFGPLLSCPMSRLYLNISQGCRAYHGHWSCTDNFVARCSLGVICSRRPISMNNWGMRQLVRAKKKAGWNRSIA